MEKLIDLLKRLEKEKFYGKLVLNYKEGKAVHAVEEKSHKLD